MMKIDRLIVIGCLVLFGATAAASPAADQMRQSAKTGAGQKVAPSLSKLAGIFPEDAAAMIELQENLGLSPAYPYDVSDGYVTVDASSTGDVDALLAELVSIGLINAATRGNTVSGRLPVSAVAELQQCPSLQFARPVAATTRAGLVTSLGDKAVFADRVRREEEVSGRGIRIGVLSDSFDCRPGALTTAADDVANGDLPADLTILDDTGCPGSDEGRAMMQLIRDVAPGASQAFHTAEFGQANFAEGIVELATVAGSDIIVDDIIYFAEPMFQDGIIAQAVDTVEAMGVPYFSSAGNNGRSAYESAFRPSGVPGVFGGDAHDFDPGPGVDTRQSFLLQPGTTTIVLQWDQPFNSVSGPPGTANDVDFIFYFNGAPLLFLSGIDFNIGGDALEIISVNFGGTTPIEIELGIELFSGSPPGQMKYVHFGSDERFGLGPQEFATRSGSIYGHAAAAGAFATGAAAYFNTKRFNSNCRPACLNSFSSAGPVEILFDTSGNAIYEVRQKPEAVGPDGGNTTFFGGDIPPEAGVDGEPDGFGNFFGTSASAPHLAAVAALILEEEDELSPGQLYKAMQRGARDMRDPFPRGIDDDTGAGFVDARRAIEAADDIDDDEEDDDDEEEEDD